MRLAQEVNSQTFARGRSRGAMLGGVREYKIAGINIVASGRVSLPSALP